MVEAGVMDGVDKVIGLHLLPTMETGTLAVDSGPMQSAVDNFDIKIIGKGGHGASPTKPLTAWPSLPKSFLICSTLYQEIPILLMYWRYQ